MSPRPLLALLLAALGGCGGGGPATPPQAQAWTDAGYVTSGPYTLHYQAQALQDVDPAVARRYGLQPGPGRGLLTLVLNHQPGGTAVDAKFTVEVRTLTGDSRSVEWRRVDDAGAASRLAEFAVPRREWLLFEVTAAVTDGPRLTARFRRELFAD